MNQINYLFNSPLFQKMLKFGVVGLSGMCLDFFTTWLCKERFSMNKYVANSIGFSVAVISNFSLNYLWTFKGLSSVSDSLGLFIVFALVGLLLNNLLIFLFNHFCSINFYISKALAIVGVFCWNFTANNLFNFHGQYH